MSVEKGSISELNTPISSPDNVLSDAERLLEKNAVRKLDWAVLPLMTMYYLLSFLVSHKYIGNVDVLTRL